uniref:NET domain-containing protein n=1 Tax=Mesocestoides corti TaxID=53468 RepID=A0A5K3EN63_MESCO
MKHQSAVHKVEHELKSLKRQQEDSKHHKKESSTRHRRRHTSSSSSRSRSPSSRRKSEELRALRDSVRQLEAIEQLLNEPPPPLTDYMADSPQQLLLAAWSVVGPEEILRLTPQNVIETCRRERRRKKRASTPTEVFLPPDCVENDEGRALWKRCLAELEQVPPEEIGAVLEGELDPFLVSWKPTWPEKVFSEAAAQTDGIDEQSPHPSTPVIEHNTTSKVQDEVLELEMRARAIRALLSKRSIK